MTGNVRGGETASRWNGTTEARAQSARVNSEPLKGIAIGLAISVVIWAMIALSIF